MPTPKYTDAETAAIYLLEKCRDLSNGGANEAAKWVGDTPGKIARVAMTGLPTGIVQRLNLERTIRRVFGTAGPFPVHTIVIDANDQHVRLYTTP